MKKRVYNKEANEISTAFIITIIIVFLISTIQIPYEVEMPGGTINLNNRVTKTIISTNLNINNIFKNYEERIGSRIAGFYDIYYFFGDDLRFKHK